MGQQFAQGEAGAQALGPGDVDWNRGAGELRQPLAAAAAGGAEALAAGLPGAELIEPPWGDDEWNERMAEVAEVGSLFVRWPLLVPQLVEWADRTIGDDRP